MKRNTEALLHAEKEVGLEVNAKKTKCISMSCHQNVEHYNLMTANKSFRNVVNLKYLETLLTKKNSESFVFHFPVETACIGSFTNNCRHIFSSLVLLSTSVPF
jgi:hypothetical protein